MAPASLKCNWTVCYLGNTVLQTHIECSYITASRPTSQERLTFAPLHKTKRLAKFQVHHGHLNVGGTVAMTVGFLCWSVRPSDRILLHLHSTNVQLRHWANHQVNAMGRTEVHPSSHEFLARIAHSGHLQDWMRPWLAFTPTFCIYFFQAQKREVAKAAIFKVMLTHFYGPLVYPDCMMKSQTKVSPAPP